MSLGEYLRLTLDVPEPYTIPGVDSVCCGVREGACNKSPLNRACNGSYAGLVLRSAAMLASAHRKELTLPQRLHVPL